MRHAGFSMTEMIIVVAIMAILAGLSAPAFIVFLNQQRVQQEQNEMDEIYKALEAFSDQFNRLPDDDPANNTFCNTVNNTWNECLSLVSNLSADQIREDAWGNARTYIHYVNTSEILLDTQVDMHYTSLHSRGEDLIAEAVPGVATRLLGASVFVDFEVPTHADWWANDATPLDDYQSLEAGGDDHMIKFTDRHGKIKRYELTLERIRKIAEALDTYAQSKFNEAVVAGEANTDTKVFFPRANDDGTGASDTAAYGNQVMADMTTYNFGADNEAENRSGGSNENTRRAEMVELMRLLGLPDSHCCNALVRDATDITQEQALFYYSNPRAVINPATPTCSARPDGVTVGRRLFLPARVSAAPHSCP
jgi:prepilin-type N-terminal cleavage/methylation domain-containing protein